MVEWLTTKKTTRQVAVTKWSYHSSEQKNFVKKAQCCKLVVQRTQILFFINFVAERQML